MLQEKELMKKMFTDLVEEQESLGWAGGVTIL